MKKSNKILLGTAVVIIAAMPVVVGLSIDVNAAAILSEATHFRQFNNFDHVIIKGTWGVQITAGNQYSVTITTSSSPQRYTAEQNGDTVTIANENAKIQDHSIVMITMPQLTNLELYGTENTTLSDFHLKDLTISLDGTHSLKGSNSQIENLKLHAAGTTSIDLADTKTTNVNLEIFGANNTKLNMQGGNLTGQARGAVSITYSGAAQSQLIETRGVAKVQQSQ